MKRYIAVLVGTVCLLLASCTSTEGALKKAAIEAAKSHLGDMLEKEANDGIKQSQWIRQGYREYLFNRSKFEAMEVRFQGESAATVTVVISTYTSKLRQTLVGVAAKADGSKQLFNFADAISMIGKQTGLPTGVDEHIPLVIKFTRNQGQWTLENPN